MFAIFGIIILVIVFIKLISLSGRVQALESDIQKIESVLRGGVQTPRPQAAPQAAEMPRPLTVEELQYVPKTSSEPHTENRFVAWMKENWLLKVGVLMILIGFGWFISYAFVHEWIGPVGRVALGFIAGSLLAVFGTMRMPKFPVQGKTFLILGSALVVITSYAAQVNYGFFSPTIATFIPFIVALFVATVGGTYNMPSVGAYAVIIGFLAPILTHGARLDENLLFIYLAVMTVACVWLSVRKNWRFINALSLAGVFLYAVAHIGSGPNNHFVLLVLFGLSALYFVISMLSIVKSKIDASGADVFVAIANSALIMIVTMAEMAEEMQSLILALWMLVFAFGSFFVFSKTGKQTFFYIYSLIAVVFLATATAIELEGTALVFACLIESAAISLASYLVTKRYDVGLKMSVLMAGPAVLALPSFFSARWYQGVVHEDFMVILVTGLVLILVGGFYHLIREKDAQEQDHSYAVHVIAGSAYLLALLWTALRAGLDSHSQAVMISLVVYSILGIICYFSGLFRSNKVVKYYGGTLLVLVVLRLVFVDVWNMPLATRIITFMLIGAIFISTAFIGRRKQVTTTTN
ncbi:MAG TPA: DUF2339 domain-containing protein [Candidatus Paceibacterota bacterium]|nr:DUF2339 domain-containing protein [Candidatus Paceibacterota bacterium]